MAISPRGRRLFVGTVRYAPRPEEADRQRITIIDPETMKVVERFDRPLPFQGTVGGDDSGNLFACNEMEGLGILAVEDRKTMLLWNLKASYARLSGDGRYLLTMRRNDLRSLSVLEWPKNPDLELPRIRTPLSQTSTGGVFEEFALHRDQGWIMTDYGSLVELPFARIEATAVRWRTDSMCYSPSWRRSPVRCTGISSSGAIETRETAKEAAVSRFRTLFHALRLTHDLSGKFLYVVTSPTGRYGVSWLVVYRSE
jgi:hypothetical protein